MQVLSVRMISVGKSFNEVTDYSKKIEGVQQVGHAKVLAKKSKNVGTFRGSSSKGSG